MGYPTIVGPIAANRYPTPWSKPESEAASAASIVRRLRNDRQEWATTRTEAEAEAEAEEEDPRHRERSQATYRG